MPYPHPRRPILLPALLLTLVQTALTFQPLQHNLQTNGIHVGHNLAFLQSNLNFRETALPTHYAQLPIDHSNPNVGNFSNRWWMNDTFYDGGPVFLYDFGEADAALGADYLLNEEGETRTSVMQLASTYKGLAIVWEHRYYGTSSPFNFTGTSLTSNLTGQQWTYISYDQALEDVVSFATNFEAPPGSSLAGKLNRTSALRSGETPWVFIGGSYPGMRAATLRVRNPEVIFASLASSATVQVEIESPTYFQTIQRGLPKNCSADYIAVVEYVDDILADQNKTRRDEVKLALNKAHNGVMSQTNEMDIPEYVSKALAQSSQMSNGNVGGILLLPLFSYQGSGYAGLSDFCDFTETRGGTFSPTDQGLATTESVDLAYEAWIAARSQWGVAFPMPEWSNLSFSLAWNYQVCTELLSFYVTSYGKDPNNIVSRFLDRSFYEEACRNTYPQGSLSSTGYDLDNVNKYGGWNMNPTRVLLTDGEFDPWRILTPASQEPNSRKRTGNATVPGCNSVYGDNSYFGIVHPGRTHVPDLTGRVNDPEPFDRTLSLFKQALDQWLPCFEPNSTTPSSAGRTYGNGNPSWLIAIISFLWTLFTAIYL